MFDLPVKRKEDRARYVLLRRFMLKDGYRMLQFSVYSRLCPNHESIKKHERRLEQYIESLRLKGQIRIISLTEKQYSAMRILIGCASYQEEKEKPDQLLLF